MLNLKDKRQEVGAKGLGPAGLCVPPGLSCTPQQPGSPGSSPAALTAFLDGSKGTGPFQTDRPDSGAEGRASRQLSTDGATCWAWTVPTEPRLANKSPPLKSLTGLRSSPEDTLVSHVD